MKKDEKQMIFRIGILLITCLAFAFLIAYGFHISGIIMLFAVAGATYWLYEGMKHNTKILKQFIWSVRYSEFQTSGSTTREIHEAIPQELTEAMEDALVHYKRQLQQKESQLQYFQALANHIDLSVIVYAPTGKLEWMNQAARLQTGMNQADTIDDLQAFHPELPARLRTIRSGDISILQVYRGDECYQLALSGMSFIVLGKQLTVVSMKNIRTVLENKETEAWQKIIRVLTHEIMNSMTPIVSLSELLKNKFSPDNQLSKEESEETNQAIETIFRRSNGLLRFVENYRKVVGIPTPVLQLISVSELLNNTMLLFHTESFGLRLIPLSSHIQIIADKNQIEQVLINLIKNAKEAILETDSPCIELSAGINTDGKTFIQVSDNGPGIDPEVLERIFIPFFTTKPTGSGIGLSLSRQIMHMHRGSLHVISEPRKGSRFSLIFLNSN